MKRYAMWLVLLLSSPAMALPPSSPREYPKRVVLQLTFQDGTPFTVSVREDGLAVYENLRFGVKIGVVPHVVDVDSGDVDLEIVSIAGEPGAQRSADRLETLRGRVGFRTVTSVARGLPLEVDVVEVGDDRASFGVHCGLACGAELVRGLTVENECGTCGFEGASQQASDGSATLRLKLPSSRF